MKIFPAKEVQEIDRFTIEHEPIVSIDLMERAARRLTEWFVKKFRPYNTVVVFAGRGNNGGDGLAMARMLAERQFKVTLCMLSETNRLTSDSTANFERILSQGLVDVIHVKALDDIPQISRDAIIIDAIFGSGLSRKVEGRLASIIQAINRMKNTVMSIDIPSGLFGEDNSGNDFTAVIKADYTISFQFPFLSFFFAENGEYVGDWIVKDIELHRNVIAEKQADYQTITKDLLVPWLPQRKRFAHKGTYGHALLICGSYGMMGAALLASEAALRAGCGLISTHIPKCGLGILQSAFPEAIASVDPNDSCFSEVPDLGKYSAVAVGPGLGTAEFSLRALDKLLESSQLPLVIDADALNIISSTKDLVNKIPEGAILTPHPKEFDRLFGDSQNTYERHLKQIEFSKMNRLIIVLKGAYTGVSFPDGSYYFNTSGNSGMATGGSGDVLTGIIVSLLAQGMRPDFAAVMGVYLHGVAGDFAANDYSKEGMIASDIIRCMGKAWDVIT